MKLTTVGLVIAERQILDETGATAYVIKIGIPQPFSDGIDFYCPVQVLASGEPTGTISYSAGVDSVQALQLAFKLVGGALIRLNQKHEGKLRWIGDEHGDLGFPIPT